jgi:hypothetical protein
MDALVSQGLFQVLSIAASRLDDKATVSQELR